MKVRMLVSLNVMPDFVVYEQGETYDVDAAIAEQWIASGLAEAVVALPTASAPDAPPADDVPAKRKRR